MAPSTPPSSQLRRPALQARSTTTTPTTSPRHHPLPIIQLQPTPNGLGPSTATATSVTSTAHAHRTSRRDAGRRDGGRKDALHRIAGHVRYGHGGNPDRSERFAHPAHPALSAHPTHPGHSDRTERTDRTERLDPPQPREHLFANWTLTGKVGGLMLSSRSWGGTPAGSPGGSRRGSDVGGEGLLGRVPQGRPMEELARMPAARRLGADEQGDGDGDEAGQEQTQMQGREITEALSATREVLVGAEAQLQGLKSGVEDAARALAGEVREMQALVQGLEGLGRKFEGDSQALEGEVRGLIERFAEFGAGAAGEQEAQEGERGGAGAAGGVQKLQIESIGKRLGAGKEKVLSLERRMLAVRQKTRDWEVQQVWRLQRRAERRRLIWSALLLALGVLVVLVGVWKPQRLLADGMGGIEDLKAAAGLLPSPDPASALAAGAEEGKITALSSRSRAVGGESLGAGLARVSGLTAMTGRQETGTCQGTGTGTGTGIGADVDADADADTRRFRAVIEGLDSL